MTKEIEVNLYCQLTLMMTVGLNSEFSFSKTGYLIKAKDPVYPNI